MVEGGTKRAKAGGRKGQAVGSWSENVGTYVPMHRAADEGTGAFGLSACVVLYCRFVEMEELKASCAQGARARCIARAAASATLHGRPCVVCCAAH